MQAALNGATGEVTRFSETVKRRMIYVAVPVFNADHQVEAVIRTALPLTQISDKVNAMTWRIVLGTLLMALVVALLGLLVSRSISGRMREIRRGAERFAAGDFAHEIHVLDHRRDRRGGGGAQRHGPAAERDHPDHHRRAQRDARPCWPA